MLIDNSFKDWINNMVKDNHDSLLFTIAKDCGYMGEVLDDAELEKICGARSMDARWLEEENL